MLSVVLEGKKPCCFSCEQPLRKGKYNTSWAQGERMTQVIIALPLILHSTFGHLRRMQAILWVNP